MAGGGTGSSAEHAGEQPPRAHLLREGIPPPASLAARRTQRWRETLRWRAGVATTVNPQFPKGKNDQGAFRHNGGATYIFVDGHAHWYRPEQIPCSAEKCWWAIEGHH
jgi:prepilin-type processing-associated H-X9-DG protein